MTDLSTLERQRKPRPSVPKPRPGKPDADTAGVSGYKLAQHLLMSRQNVDLLTSQGVLTRKPNGRFDLDQNRAAYIAFLRQARRGSPGSEAQARFTRAKARLIEMRIAERERTVIAFDEAIATIDEMVGLTLTHMSAMPARIAGNDLQLRRKVERCIFETRTAISEAASRLADERGEAPEDDAA